MTDQPRAGVVHVRKAPYDVYVGRPSKWGNPFAIGRDGTRAEVIEKYEWWLHGQPDLLAALPDLAGKVLGCWCAPLPCHADVLARRANALSGSSISDKQPTDSVDQVGPERDDDV